MIEGLFAPMHLLIIGGIALLVFGPSRLPELGRGFGQAIRGFKAGLEEIGATSSPAPPQLTAEVPPRVDPAPRFGSGMRENDTIDASAAVVGEPEREAHPASDVVTKQPDDLESRAAKARRGAELEIEQALEQSKDFPVAAREKLTFAIERAERTLDEVEDRLNELGRADKPDSGASRRRVIEALQELEHARHDVVAAFAGGVAALPQGG